MEYLKRKWIRILLACILFTVASSLFLGNVVMVPAHGQVKFFAFLWAVGLGIWSFVQGWDHGT